MVHPRPTSTLLREYSGIPSLSPLLVGPARGGKERVMAVSLLVDPDEAGCVQPSNGTTSPWSTHGEDRTTSWLRVPDEGPDGFGFPSWQSSGAPIEATEKHSFQ